MWQPRVRSLCLDTGTSCTCPLHGHQEVSCDTSAHAELNPSHNLAQEAVGRVLRGRQLHEPYSASSLDITVHTTTPFLYLYGG